MIELGFYWSLIFSLCIDNKRKVCFFRWIYAELDRFDIVCFLLAEKLTIMNLSVSFCCTTNMFLMLYV